MKQITLGLVLTFALFGNTMMAQEIEKKYSKEVERLTKKKEVGQAFDIIRSQKDQTTQDLITLTEVLAPPFMEDERGKVFAKMLEEAGVDSLWTDKVGNVIGLRSISLRNDLIDVENKTGMNLHLPKGWQHGKITVATDAER